MARYIHLFETVTEFNEKRQNDYLEPWLGYTIENSGISFNKTEYEKLLETPLSFNIVSSGTIVWKAQNTAYTVSIEYSLNDGEWTTITSNTGDTSISVSEGDTIQFRGNNATYASGDVRYNTFSGSTAKFEVEGNIMSLIDSENFATATTLASSYTFYCLFCGCTGLTSAENLVLPATTLAGNCYRYMFNSCTSLTSAPTLPATTLAGNCYNGMFRGCTGLTSAPTLPATTLAGNCYSSMFSGCTSLATAPELPATTLTYGCYSNMFYGCTNLISAPAILPATILTENCYWQMFYNCTSLTSAPELPATTLAEFCYSYMFQGCTSLTTAPELPATTLAQGCYAYMFWGCRNLNYIKCLTRDISAWNCTSSWVYGVSSTGTFVKNPGMLSWTTGNDGIPNGWNIYDDDINVPSQTTVSQDGGTYEVKISSLVNWSASTEDSWITFAKNTGTSEDTSFTFSVTSIIEPRTGFITFSTSKYEVVLEVVQDSSSVEPLSFIIVSSGTIVWKAQNTYTTTIEYSLNDGETWTSITSNTGASAPSISVTAGDTIQFRGNNATYSSGSSYNTFSGSTAKFKAIGNIMSLIDSENFVTATTLANSYTFNYLFRDCTGLTFAKNLVLPAETLTSYCYQGMFSGCKSLTSAPTLPATTLATYCYDSMFRGCTSLTTAPALPAETLTNYCYQYMFYGCTSLTTAPALPAETLANYCYQYMFQNCTDLTSVPEILPATALAYSCYGSMFDGCSSLTSAPELPAETLMGYCYYHMFYYCRNLNYIKCLARSISASNCTTDWVYGVSSTGTFAKNARMVSWPRGTRGIPNNWSIQDAY